MEIYDDIKSQLGATIIHRNLTRLFMERGIHIDRTYQLNFGGNMDFFNAIYLHKDKFIGGKKLLISIIWVQS